MFAQSCTGNCAINCEIPQVCPFQRVSGPPPHQRLKPCWQMVKSGYRWHSSYLSKTYASGDWWETYSITEESR